MRKTKMTFFIMILFICILLVNNAYSDKRGLSFQGKLTDKQNNVLTGPYNLTFKLHDKNDTEIWSETHGNVSVNIGNYSVVLGTNTSNPLNNTIFTQDVWLSVTVNNEEMTPKIKVTGSAYAITVDKKSIVPGFGLVPSGAIMMWPSDVAPDGWLECNGQEVTKADHPQLYAVIGDTYGTPGDPNNFVLPDFRGVFIRGADNRTVANGGRDPDGIRQIGSYQEDGFKEHNHNTSVYSCPDTYRGAGGNSGAWFYPYGGGNVTQTDYSGGNETRPKNIALMYIIKK